MMNTATSLKLTKMENDMNTAALTLIIIALVLNTGLQIVKGLHIETLNKQITVLENQLDAASKEPKQCINDK